MRLQCPAASFLSTYIQVFFSFFSPPSYFALSAGACPLSTCWALCVVHNLKTAGTRCGCGNLVCCANKTDWTRLGPTICRCLFGSPSLLNRVLCVPRHWFIVFEAQGKSTLRGVQVIERTSVELPGVDPLLYDPRHPEFNQWTLDLKRPSAGWSNLLLHTNKDLKKHLRATKNNLSVGGPLPSQQLWTRMARAAWFCKVKLVVETNTRTLLTAAVPLP